MGNSSSTKSTTTRRPVSRERELRIVREQSLKYQRVRESLKCDIQSLEDNPINNEVDWLIQGCFDSTYNNYRLVSIQLLKMAYTSDKMNITTLYYQRIKRDVERTCARALICAQNNNLSLECFGTEVGRFNPDIETEALNLSYDIPPIDSEDDIFAGDRPPDYFHVEDLTTDPPPYYQSISLLT